MKIVNVRYGFATNSSSSHSVILAPGLRNSGFDIDGLGYGWDNFLLTTPEMKLRYLFTAAFLHYKHELSAGEAAALARIAFPVDEADFQAAVGSDPQWSGDCYIDHQSYPHFPRPRVKSIGMQPLWNLFNREIVHNDDVVVAGGNDNQDNEEWKPIAAQYAPRLALWQDFKDATHSTFMYDANTGHFTVFNRKTGKKVRIVPTGAESPKFSNAPELVDIKITDYCPVGCSFCYQNSTKQGKHAELNDISNFAHHAGLMGVQEVAIGGGDPTTHPDFIKILRVFSENGVVPNFSTQLMDWLDDPDTVSTVKECCGAVALSTQNASLAKKFMNRCNALGIKPHIHYVLGLSPLANLKKMLKLETSTWDQHIVLLAYKQMGRAANTPPVPYNGWQKVVRNNRGYRWTVAVDSFLVDEVKTGFTREEVPDVLYENGDGRFSCYWDAVTGDYAAHSFTPQSERISVGKYHSSKLAEAWERITGR